MVATKIFVRPKVSNDKARFHIARIRIKFQERERKFGVRNDSYFKIDWIVAFFFSPTAVVCSLSRSSGLLHRKKIKIRGKNLTKFPANFEIKTR